MKKRKGQFFIIAGIAFSIALYWFVSGLFLSKTATFERNEELEKLVSADRLITSTYKKVSEIDIYNPNASSDLILIEMFIREYIKAHNLEDYDFNYYFTGGSWKVEMKIKDKDIYLYKKILK